MTERAPIVILGTAGNCLDILETLRDLGHECAGFLDDDKALWGTMVDGVPVLGGLERAAGLKGVGFVNGIGSPTSYHRKAAILAGTGLGLERFVSLRHPTAAVARSATIGSGVTILPHAFVGARARVGDHVFILPQGVVSHDAVLGDHTIVASGAVVSGGVTVGAGAYLGAGSLVRQGVGIGAGALVGMGAVVVADVAPYKVVVGNPARVLRDAERA